jgi:N-acetylglucosamine-6-sulfatase
VPVQARAASASGKPNVVVIETDDQTVTDLSSMPRTRALIGGQGVYFSQSVVSESQCCPARATFLTGQYAHNHHVLTTDPPFGGFTAFHDSQSLAVWLQQAGYSTTLVGKYFNRYGRVDRTYIPPGWDEWHVPLGPTLYRFFGFILNNDGVLRGYPGSYQTDILTGIAEDVIRRRAAAAKPMFLWLTYVAPHIGMPRDIFSSSKIRATVPSPLFSGTFPDTQLPFSPAFNEADVSDKPRNIRGLPPINTREYATMTDAWRRRQQSLLSVDYGVQRVVEALRRSGQLDNTLILFLSDNGFMSGQHRVRAGKVLPYEPSIRVPLMIRGPGIPRGRTSSQLVWNGDLAPTILQATGAKPAWEPDGESLWPFLRDPGLRVKRDVVLEGPPLGRKSPAPRFTGLRTPRYVYVEYLWGDRELYDLRRDPAELHNLAGQASARRLQQRLARRLAELRTCAGADCHTEPPALP